LPIIKKSLVIRNTYRLLIPLRTD